MSDYDKSVLKNKAKKVYEISNSDERDLLFKKSSRFFCLGIFLVSLIFLIFAVYSFLLKNIDSGIILIIAFAIFNGLSLSQTNPNQKEEITKLYIQIYLSYHKKFLDYDEFYIKTKILRNNNKNSQVEINEFNKNKTQNAISTNEKDPTISTNAFVAKPIQKKEQNKDFENEEQKIYLQNEKTIPTSINNIYPVVNTQNVNNEHQPKTKSINRQKIEEVRKQRSITHISNLIRKVKSLFKNNRLEKITYSYLKEKELNEIEVIGIPCKTTKSGNIKPIFKIEDIRDIPNIQYIEHTLKAGYFVWNKNKKAISLANRSQTFKDAKTLYDALKNSKIIRASFSEFCCYLSEKQYLLKKECYNKILDTYNLSVNETPEELTQKLYKLNFNELKILHIVALSNYIQSCPKPFINSQAEVENVVRKQIIKLKQETFIKRLESGKFGKRSIDEIDLMSGTEFESFIADLFYKLGYETQLTKKSGDQGIDIIAKNNNFTIAIQAKCYNNIVGNHAIMEAVAGTKYYKADKCMVITNNYFSKAAIDLAKANNVELWNRDVLMEKIALYNL